MVGKTLSHYRITAELGRGGMGIVYRAEDTKLDRTVAIKVLPAAALASEDDRARFYREAKAAAQLHHPHIASVFEIDEAVPRTAEEITRSEIDEASPRLASKITRSEIDEASPRLASKITPSEIDPRDSSNRGEDSRPFIVMEYIEGETLDARIKKGPLKLNDAVRIAREVASALEAAHEKGIVHRDIKSANVMLTAKDTAKVLDFGLAQTAQSTKLTRMGSTLGTVAYMSPEQARGEEVDARTDLWSLGVILYEMISGRSPFPGDYEQAVVYEILNQQPEPLTAVRTGVPMELERIAIKCMAKEARARFQSATDLIVDLENVDTMTSRLSASQTASSSAVNAGPAPPPATNESARWRPIVLTALATAVVCVVAFLAFPRSEQAEDAQLRKLRVQIPGIEFAFFPEMNAEGSELYFAGQDTASEFGIYRLDLETEKLDLVVPYGQQPRLSPDGTQLAYLFVGEDRDVFEPYVMGLPNARPRSLPDSMDTFFWMDNQTVGGRVRSGADAARTAVVFNLETSNEETIVDIRDDDRGGGLYFTGSRLDSDLILYNHEFWDGSSPILYLFDVGSRSSSMLFEGGMNGYFLGQDHILYQTADGAELLLQAVDLKASTTRGRALEILPQVDWVYYTTTRDGEFLYFDEPLQDQWMKVHDGEGNVIQAHRLPTFSAGWTANRSGTTLVGIERASASTISGRVVLFDVASGTVSTILEPRPGIRGVSWSYNERQIRILEGADLKTLRIFGIPANGIGREIPLENDLDMEYSSDGSKSIFARITAGADSVAITARNEISRQERVVEVFAIPGGVSGARISPDGEYLQIRRGDERWVTAFDGGATHPIPPELDRWGPSGQYLYGSQDGNIIRAPYSTDGGFRMTGPLEIVLEADDSDASLISVQPDRILTINGEYVNDYVVLHWWQNYAESLGG